MTRSPQGLELSSQSFRALETRLGREKFPGLVRATRQAHLVEELAHLVEELAHLVAQERQRLVEPPDYPARRWRVHSAAAAAVGAPLGAVG